jgi:hypothetical protein
VQIIFIEIFFNLKLQTMKKLLFTLLAFSVFVNAQSQFVGPINAVYANTKTAWIYPTNDKDLNSISSLKDYVSEMFNNFKTEGSLLIPDSVAVTQDLSTFGLVVYGTLSTNLYLRKYKSLLTFRIENNAIIFGDNEYREANTRLITCLPNPQNKNKGMIIYTALTNGLIIGINEVFHGPQDFVISYTGNYDKSGTDWKYVKK